MVKKNGFLTIFAVCGHRECGLLFCSRLFRRRRRIPGWRAATASEYTLTQENRRRFPSPPFSDPLPGTLRGACYYDRYLYALTQQDGTLFFSACFCLTHTIRTVSLTDAFPGAAARRCV